MNLVVTGAQPGEQPGKAGAALPGGGATARDPKCFFDSRYDEDVILLLRGAGPSVQNFDKSGTTNLCFFFVALLPGGFNLRSLQKIQDMIERRSNTGVPMSHLMSCELCRCADVLFRVFHLFFKKLPLSVFCFWTIGRRN